MLTSKNVLPNNGIGGVKGKDRRIEYPDPIDDREAVMARIKESGISLIRSRRIFELSKILSKTPFVSPKVLSKKLGVKRRQIDWDIAALREAGDAGAIERAENWNKQIVEKSKRLKEVYQYVLENPLTTRKEIAEAFGVDTNIASNLITELEGKIKGFKVNRQYHVISKTMMKKKIMDYLLTNPNSTIPEVSRAMGWNFNKIRKLIAEIDDELMEEIIVKRSVMTSYLLKELLHTKQVCDDRLEQIKSPHQGSRYIELRIAVLKEIRTLMRLGAPDMEVNVSVSLDKDQRDAAAKAIAESQQIDSIIDLPDFSKSLPAPEKRTVN